MKTSKKLKNVFLDLVTQIYGAVWNNSEQHLYEFNKTIITLSSSVLVLSFSIIQFTKSNVDKNSVKISWLALVLALIVGVALYFFRFIVSILYEKIKVNEDKIGVVTRDNFFEHRAIAAYSFLIILSFVLGFLQLIFFISGIVLLMSSALNLL